MILCGPSSVKSLKNPSHARINRFGLKRVPSAVIPFAATVVG